MAHKHRGGGRATKDRMTATEIRSPISSAYGRLYKPQLEAYVARAIDPSSSPSFGVPGDE